MLPLPGGHSHFGMSSGSVTSEVRKSPEPARASLPVSALGAAERAFGSRWRLHPGSTVQYTSRRSKSTPPARVSVLIPELPEDQ